MPDMSMNYKWTRRPLQMTGRCGPTNQKATSQSFGEHFQNPDTTEHSVRQKLDHQAKSGTFNLSHRTSVRAGAMFCLANRTGACVVVAGTRGTSTCGNVSEHENVELQVQVQPSSFEVKSRTESSNIL